MKCDYCEKRKATWKLLEPVPSEIDLNKKHPKQIYYLCPSCSQLSKYWRRDKERI